MSGTNQGPAKIGTPDKTRPNHPTILIDVLLLALDGAPVDQAHKVRRHFGAPVAPVEARLRAPTPGESNSATAKTIAPARRWVTNSPTWLCARS
jgi:hypothetical protein